MVKFKVTLASAMIFMLSAAGAQSAVLKDHPTTDYLGLNAGIIGSVLSEDLALNREDADGRATNVALLVKEEINGVTVYRNVKTFTSIPTREVRPVVAIGSTQQIRPDRVLGEQDLEGCKRRLRSLEALGSISVDGVFYCQ